MEYILEIHHHQPLAGCRVLQLYVWTHFYMLPQGFEPTHDLSIEKQSLYHRATTAQLENVNECTFILNQNSSPKLQAC